MSIKHNRNKKPELTIEVAGENAIIVYFATTASLVTSSRVHMTAVTVKAIMQHQLIDLVPSYASLLIIYDLEKIDFAAVCELVDTVVCNLESEAPGEGRLVTLPVYYSCKAGPDLERLADNANLSVDGFIDIHQSREYQVYAIGFAPGFAYLGELDQRIAAPRLATPRKKVPRGAVAIADRQTAVYPSESPGGWNIIGLCPRQMFDPKAVPTMPVEVGDRVKFEAISERQFFALGGVL